LSHSTINGLIGVFLFATGLVALHAVSSPAAPQSVPPATMSPVPPQMALEQPARIEGVGPAVEQVLFSSGQAVVLAADALSQIPPEVTRVLIEHGVVLTIPDAGQP
jgi:hypothetical protein